MKHAALLGLLGLLTACAAPAPVEVAALAGEPVAPDVALLQGAFVAGQQPDGNTLLLRGRDGVVVFDTGRHVTHVQRIIDAARGARLPVVAIVNSHWHLDHVSGYVAMNVSPATLLTPECGELLARLPLTRVLLELSEHDQVEDYATLQAALEPFRARGLRLAIDDVGAGFSSLRHIVVTTPDVIKLDRTLVDGVTGDPVLRTLVRSLVDFAHGFDATVVAEGVETAADATTLLALDVDLGQGWHFGRPGPAADLADCPPRATRSASSPRAAAATG